VLAVEPEVPSEPETDSRKDRQGKAGRTTPAKGGGGGVLMVIVIGLFLIYSLVMTGLTAYFWSESRRVVEPLEVIPDVYKQFKDAAPGKSVSLKGMPAVDARLPPQLITRLGGTVTVGALAVTPVAIEQRTNLPYFVQPAGKAAIERKFDGQCLVLRLRVKNVSAEQQFCPNDPAYDREGTNTAARPYTFVDANSRKFFGGVRPWPFAKGIEMEYFQGRENDRVPLKPGEERETFVTSLADTPRDNILATVAKTDEAKPALWRVQLCRGEVVSPKDGKSYSVCTVVGVQFTGKDVKKSS
jgi:hypothetical protein